jgi:hypothetical protein
MSRIRSFALAGVLLTLCSVFADPFEIQVYEYELVPPGRWNLETHLNYVARGIRDFEGSVAPSEGQTHLTFELTRGLWTYFELAGYLVTARREGTAGELAGWRLRPRFALPPNLLPFKFSLSTEFGFPKKTFEENSITFELRPILERSFRSIQIDVNPVVSKALRGPAAAEDWDFEPGARIAYSASRELELTLEYYGATGAVTHPLPVREQVHQLFPGVDLRLSDDIVWNLGVGFGATGAGNTRVYKTRLGLLF